MPGRTFVTNSEGEGYQFTGHEFDSETTYDYHGARYYNRELGRYMSVDPLAMKFQGWSTDKANGIWSHPDSGGEYKFDSELDTWFNPKNGATITAERSHLSEKSQMEINNYNLSNQSNYNKNHVLDSGRLSTNMVPVNMESSVFLKHYNNERINCI